MSEDRGALSLARRDGLPDALRVLLAEYPREAWESHPNLTALMRFWLERGVDGFRLDTVNYYFHDRILRNDPADFRPQSRNAWRPYDMLYHLFSKNQPENIGFLERIRALLDRYG